VVKIEEKVKGGVKQNTAKNRGGLSFLGG